MSRTSSPWRLLAALVVTMLLVAACGGGGTATQRASGPAASTGGGGTSPTAASPAGGESPGAASPSASAGGASPSTDASPSEGGASPSEGAASPSEGAASAPAGGGTITVLSLWSGAERANFQAVTDAFTTATGIQVQYETARDFLPVLRTRIEANNPPMVAIIPRPGVMIDLAQDGNIRPLAELGVGDLSANFSQAWIDLGTAEGQLYGIAVKANSKSTIWYKPESFQEQAIEVPQTWDQLLAAAQKYVAAGKKPFAVGAKDSWNLTDIFENIYARTAGADKYSQLFAGELPFNDQSVKDALNRMMELYSEENIAGGRSGALGTGFVDGIGQAFGEQAQAEMFIEGGFVGNIAIGDVNPNLEAGTDIDFFPFPTIDEAQGSPLVGGGDLAVAFVDNPDVRQFMAFLASAESGNEWAKTGTISPNQGTDPENYPTELNRKEAEQVTAAEVFRFDGSDLLPGALGEAWGSALQGVFQNPADMDRILDEFQSQAESEFGGV